MVVARVLLEHGANPDAVNKVTLIIIDKMYVPCLGLFIHMCINQNGDTPLQIAVRYGYGGITKLLLEHGANADKVTLMIDNNVHYQNEGSLIIMMITRQLSLATVRLIPSE